MKPALALILVLWVCAAHASATAAADARFKAIYSAEWKWRLEQLPDDENSDAPVRDHLPRVDPDAQAGRLRYWAEVMRQLATLDRARLSPANQINYAVYRGQIGVLLASQRMRDYEMPVNADTTFWTNLGYTARRPFRNHDDYRRWIAQMRDVPRYFREQMDLMRAGSRRGFTPPRITLQGRDSSITAVTETTPERSLFYTPFVDMHGVAADQQAELRTQAIAAIRDAVQPAYIELLRFMRSEYLPRTRTSLAAADLPDGRAYYRAKIAEFTTLDWDPDRIHAFGEAEVGKLHAQMLDAMKASGFSGGFDEFLAFLRSDPRFAAKTPEELLMRAAWIAKEFDGKAAQYFGYLPRARFAIRPVPNDLAPFYTAGRGGPGTYWLNTYDLPSRRLYNLTALTLHESAPGHAFQVPIAEEHKGQPEFRQSTYISAYGEGWALYCEHLGLEMGMYTTAYDRFGELGYQIWRAARLVVDTGIHAKGWSRERAIAYMRRYTALSDHEVETEVDRYISWPAQALSYYLGEATILQGRDKAERALGPAFNIRAFHDAVLELGSVPMPVLTDRIDRFIAEGGRGPYPELEM